MKLETLKNDFSNIGTVVFYRHHKYIPDELDQIPVEERLDENFTSDLVKYHGSSSNFPALDFAEYDFSYIIDKYKFDNKLAITELDEYSREIVGKNIEDTDKIGKVLFPTLVEEDSNTYDYFGSLNVNNKMLYFFECPEYYYTIEVYEDIIDSNVVGGDSFIEYKYLELKGVEDKITPALIITLGPEREAYNNPTDFYYESDPMISRINRNSINYDTLEYSKLVDELFSKKVICLFLSTNNDTVEFNLAYSAWKNNVNSHRNKWEYSVRNDEYYDVKKNVDIVEKDYSMFLDKKSDTILGNKIYYNFESPIKNKKLQKLENQTQYYSPYRCYNKGEITTYKTPTGDIVWESLVDGNIGNNPLISPKWILSNKFFDFLTNVVYIVTNPNNTNSSLVPGNQVTVTNNQTVNFSLVSGLGYSFNGLDIITPEEEIVPLIQDVDYTYIEEETPETYTETVSVSNWADLIDLESHDRYSLRFNFTDRPSSVVIKAIKGGTIYPYSEWNDEFGTDNLSVVAKLNGEVVNIDPETGKIIIPNPQLLPELSLEFSGYYQKNFIVSNYRIGSEKTAKTIQISKDIATDTVDFADSEYIIDVNSIQKRVNVKTGQTTKIRCDVDTVLYDYGTSHVIDFSVEVPEIRFNSLKISGFYYNDYGRIERYPYILQINYSDLPYTGSLYTNPDDPDSIIATITLKEDGENELLYHLGINNIIENLAIVIDDPIER